MFLRARFLPFLLILACATGLVFSVGARLGEAAATPPFVRTASYYLLSGSALETPEALEALSAFDLLIIPSEAQAYNRAFFAEMRRRHPGIIILAYVPTVSWNDRYWSDPVHVALKSGIRPEWWLTNPAGGPVSVWPGTRALNLTGGWTDYLANHVANEVLSTGLWDGVFYDEMHDSLSWLGPVDLDRDGRAEEPSAADARWVQGYANLFRRTRELAGRETIIINNGGIL